MGFLGPALGFITSTLVPLATTGFQIASSVGAFGKGGGGSSGDAAYARALREQEVKDKKALAEEERKKKLYAWRLAGGKGGSILTSGKGVQTGNILKSQLGA